MVGAPCAQGKSRNAKYLHRLAFSYVMHHGCQGIRQCLPPSCFQVFRLHPFSETDSLGVVAVRLGTTHSPHLWPTSGLRTFRELLYRWTKGFVVADLTASQLPDCPLTDLLVTEERWCGLPREFRACL